MKCYQLEPSDAINDEHLPMLYPSAYLAPDGSRLCWDPRCSTLDGKKK